MKDIIFSLDSPFGGEPLPLYKHSWDGGENNAVLTVVGGLHGNHVNGMFLVSRLARFLQTDAAPAGYRLAGKVRLFPVVNLPAAQDGARTWAFDNLDLDLAFPGAAAGETADRACQAVLEHTADSTWAILLTAPPEHYREAPHVRLLRPDGQTRRLARHFGLAAGREGAGTPLTRLQLPYHWARRGIAAFELRTGNVGSIDPAACEALFNGMIDFMLATGILAHREKKAAAADTVFYPPENEQSIMASRPGLFLAEVRAGARVGAGQKIGMIQDVFSGAVVEEFAAPQAGILVTLREYPLVYEKEPVAILLAEDKRWKWPW